MQILATTPDTIFKDTGRPTKYPFENLNPGQCLAVPVTCKEDINRAKAAIYAYRKYHKLPWKIATRIKENHIYIHRIS